METLAILSAPEISGLDPADRVALLDKLAGEVFEGPGLVTRLTGSMDISRFTWSRWHREPDKLPVWPILLMQEWALRKRLSADLARLPGDGSAQSGSDAHA